MELKDKIIATLALLGVTTVSIFSFINIGSSCPFDRPNELLVMDEKLCLSDSELLKAKSILIAKVLANQALTFNEYYLYIGIINFEIRKKEGISIDNIDTMEVPLDKINNEIKQ